MSPGLRRWQNPVPMPCGGSFAAPAAGEEVFPGGHRGGCARDAAWVLIGEDGETAIGFRCDECRKREGLAPSTAPEGGPVDLPRAIEAALTPWVISHPLPRLDAAVAAQVDAAPGPGRSVRPFEHPRLPEVSVEYLYEAGVPERVAWVYGFLPGHPGMGRLVTVGGDPLRSVGPFPVEPLVPPAPALSLRADDGAAARQTREARADRFEDAGGRVEGVDRG